MIQYTIIRKGHLDEHRDGYGNTSKLNPNLLPPKHKANF